MHYSLLGHSARTLKPNASYHDLKYPVYGAKINLGHYAVRAAYPAFFNLHSGVPLMSHFRRTYVPGGSFFFTVVTERRAPILCTIPPAFSCARSLANAANAGLFGLMQWFCSTITFMPS